LVGEVLSDLTDLEQQVSYLKSRETWMSSILASMPHGKP
jgi:hypothetical protein